MQIEKLQSNRLFQSMTADEIEETLAAFHASIRPFRKGQTILHTGSRTDSICVVLSGSVTVESNDLWGNRTILNIMGAGDFFAETYAVLREETLLVDAVANEPCDVLFLHIGRLFTAPFTPQPWTYKLLRNLLVISAGKNLMRSGRAFHIAPKTARGRIMAYLNSVATKQQSRALTIPFDRQQLADYLNLERTALSKALSLMKKEGILDYHKNHFRLP